MSDLEKCVEKLIKAAAEDNQPADAALKFSQAACNAANAICSLKHLRDQK